MEKHRCKICSRRFSNGKAMGGHMRSHLAKLPIPPKIHHQAQELTESTLTPSSSSSSSHAKQQKHNSLSLNNFKSTNSDPSSVHDRESESESSPKNPTRKRSRRTRKFTIESPAAETESASSVCEEDVAMSLIMLSRDKWGTQGKVVAFKEDHETETEENSTENEDEEDNTLFNARRRSRAIYKCETCKKVFQSYQALGGHRASHKKTRTRIQDDEQTEWSIHGGGGGNGGYDRNVDYKNRRIFECPFCYKVFESGQALGGHKKVHLSNARTKSSTSSAKFRDNWIDLNLPAPEEDEDSTVSNAEFPFQFK